MMKEPKKDRLYRFVSHRRFLKEIAKYGGLDQVASLGLGIPVKEFIRIKVNDTEMEYDIAEQIALSLKIPFDQMFYESDLRKPPKRDPNKVYELQDKTDLKISEEILLGLKRNISEHLSICHDEHYVKEIMSLIDDIIIEASYMGVNCQIDGSAGFIIKAIKKRRTEI